MHGLAVVGAVPRIGRGDNRAVKIEPAVDAFGSTEGNEVRREIRLRPRTDRPRGHSGVATQLDRVGKQGVQPLFGHHQGDDLGHRDPGLEANARRGKRVERRADPLAGLRIASKDDGASAGTAEDEPGLGNLRRDHDGLGAFQVALQPGHVGVAQKVRERAGRIGDEVALVGLRENHRCGQYRPDGKDQQRAGAARDEAGHGEDPVRGTSLKSPDRAERHCINRDLGALPSADPVPIHLRSGRVPHERVPELGAPGVIGRVEDPEVRGKVPIGPFEAARFDRLAYELRVAHARGVVRLVVRAELSDPYGPHVPARPR